MDDLKLTPEQISNLKKLAEKFDPDFDYECEHWDDGNLDDSHSYGVECGEQYVYGHIASILGLQ